jgi:hypothetical protein
MKATAQAAGFSGIGFVVVPHPLAGNSDAAINKKADDSVEELIRCLLAAGEMPTV